MTVNLISQLLDSDEYNAILDMIDRKSKRLWSILMNIDLSAEEYACLFIDHVFQDIEFPCKIISDQGPQFISKFTKALYILLSIEVNPFTAYYLQIDSQTECIN